LLAVSRFADFLTRFRLLNKQKHPGIVMDARRFDRNADQLSQIFWHLNRLYINPANPARALKDELVISLEECLRLNDELGKMAELGLI
jgi:hypothetical protein